ncbi:fibrous sheath CABYR-binding protein [Gracilaria domingensis]|nr:fibrous sheath CABYR-binding protein [Gracilaria domingensis]
MNSNNRDQSQHNSSRKRGRRNGSRSSSASNGNSRDRNRHAPALDTPQNLGARSTSNPGTATPSAVPERRRSVSARTRRGGRGSGAPLPSTDAVRERSLQWRRSAPPPTLPIPDLRSTTESVNRQRERRDLNTINYDDLVSDSALSGQGRGHRQPSAMPSTHQRGMAGSSSQHARRMSSSHERGMPGSSSQHARRMSSSHERGMPGSSLQPAHRSVSGRPSPKSPRLEPVRGLSRGAGPSNMGRSTGGRSGPSSGAGPSNWVQAGRSHGPSPGAGPSHMGGAGNSRSRSNLTASVASPPAVSQPAASQPAASQTAASQPAASQPAASQPGASPPTASQLAAAQLTASQLEASH